MASAGWGSRINAAVSVDVLLELEGSLVLIHNSGACGGLDRA